MSNLFENLQLLKEASVISDKVVKKEYKNIDRELKSLSGIKLVIHGEDNHNNIANTYLLQIEKITKNKKYLHEYLLDSTMVEGLEIWLDKLKKAKYINDVFKVINEMNELGFIKNIHNEK